MNNSRYLKLITFLFIGFLAFKSFEKYAIDVKDTHCLATQISSRLFDFNTFEISVDSSLKLNDFEVVNENSGKTIFANGQNLKGIKNEYGLCTFLLYQEGKLIYELGHFKYNNWNTYKYELRIATENNDIKPILNIYGINNKKENLIFRKAIKNNE